MLSCYGTRKNQLSINYMYVMYGLLRSIPTTHSPISMYFCPLASYLCQALLDAVVAAVPSTLAESPPDIGIWPRCLGKRPLKSLNGRLGSLKRRVSLAKSIVINCKRSLTLSKQSLRCKSTLSAPASPCWPSRRLRSRPRPSILARTAFPAPGARASRKSLGLWKGRCGLPT